MERSDQQSLIRFSSFEEIKVRPRWRERLDAAQHKPTKAIGYYDWASKDRIQCGFCRQWHFHGIVAETETGLESHMGRDCARPLLGDDFAAFKRDFEDRKEAQERRVWLAARLADRDTMLAQAKTLAARLEAIHVPLTKIADVLRHEESVRRAAETAQRLKGAIRAIVRTESKSADGTNVAMKDREGFQVLAIVDAMEVIRLARGAKQNAASDAIELRGRVIPELIGLASISLEGLTSRQQSKLSLQFKDLQGDLDAAAEYLAAAERFLMPANLLKLAMLQPEPMTHQTRKALDAVEAMVRKFARAA